MSAAASPTRRCRALVVAVAALGALGAVPGVPEATAESNARGHTVVSNQEFRAYVRQGEKVRFAVRVARTSVRSSRVAYSVVLNGPGGVADRCRIRAGAPVGTDCVLGPARARRTGIWQAVVTATGAPDIEGINATTHGPAAIFPTLDWDLTVRSAGGAALRGRVWAPERYSMFNRSSGSPAEVHAGAAPLTLFYLHDNGWLYRAHYPSYNGIYSRHRATSLGVVSTRTGVPLYRSTSNQVPRAVTIDHQEQDYFKIFFDRPDPAMPPTATAWDGRTLVLNRAPAPLEPAVRGLTFRETDDMAGHAGAYELQVLNHSGVVVVVIDTDLDGRAEPTDVRITHPVTAGAGGATVRGTWDGKGPDGAVVDPRRPVKIWATIDRAGEIHFTSSDVEYRSGIDVRRLNGTTGGRSTLYWDDRSLRLDGRHRASTRRPDGRAGVDSTGGVHDLPTAGSGGGLGWGNERFIDDWTYVPVGIAALAATDADVRLLKTRVGTGPVTPGDRITWQVRIGNFGAATATDVVVTDLDVDAAELDDLALSDPSVGTVDGLTWRVGDLAPNSTATITVAATVVTGATGPLENRAVVRSPDDPTGPPADPETECEDNATLPGDQDNCDLVLVPVTPDPADVVIDKQDLEVEVDEAAGTGTVTWRVRVRNDGPGIAPDVVVEDLPTGGADAGLTVVGTPTRGTFDAATRTWSVGDLEEGQVAEVVVRTQHPLAALRRGVVNTATVTTPVDPLEPGGECQVNEDLDGDTDNCDQVTVVTEPPGEPVEPPVDPPTEPPVDPVDPPTQPTGGPPYLPDTGGPAVVGLVGGLAAVLLGLGLLVVGGRRRQRVADRAGGARR